MQEQPSYYAVIPANVRYDETLTANAKLLYGEITALCQKEGYCWASNAYFAELYGVSNGTVSRWIGQLEAAGHISSEVIRDENKAVAGRRILLRGLSKMSIPSPQNCEYPSPQNCEDNTTSDNTTRRKEREWRFAPPTREEVESYAREKDYNGFPVDRFIAYYESNGWMVGRSKMKSWKASMTNWWLRGHQGKPSQPKLQVSEEIIAEWERENDAMRKRLGMI